MDLEIMNKSLTNGTLFKRIYYLGFRLKLLEIVFHIETIRWNMGIGKNGNCIFKIYKTEPQKYLFADSFQMTSINMFFFHMFIILRTRFV